MNRSPIHGRVKFVTWHPPQMGRILGAFPATTGPRLVLAFVVTVCLGLGAVGCSCSDSSITDNGGSAPEAVENELQSQQNSDPRPSTVSANPDLTPQLGDYASAKVHVRYGFPPEYTGPSSIRVVPEPVEPSRAANTGDSGGKWPDYRPPRAIVFAPPPVPPEIAGPAAPQAAPSP